MNYDIIKNLNSLNIIMKFWPTNNLEQYHRRFHKKTVFAMLLSAQSSYLFLRFIVKCLIVWERDLGASLGLIDTPSDKLVIHLVSISVFVSVAKMSAEFGGKALLGARLSCYLAAGEVVFRLWSLRNHRCILCDVTSGSSHQLDASFFFPFLSSLLDWDRALQIILAGREVSRHV